MTKRKLPPNACVVVQEEGARLVAPSASNNADVICDLLRSVAPDTGRALELATFVGEGVWNLVSMLKPVEELDEGSGLESEDAGVAGGSPSCPWNIPPVSVAPGLVPVWDGTPWRGGDATPPIVLSMKAPCSAMH